VTVDVATTVGAAVMNTADVSGGGESNTANNTASDPTTIIQLSDLTITKSHAGNFTQGQTGATYTITVTNSGAGATSGTVTVTDTLPAGLTPTAPNGVVNGWTCGIAGQTVTCTRSDALAASASYPAIPVTVDVATTAGAAVTNTADVSGGSESNTANNSASDPTTITQLSADLRIAKTHAGNFTQGQTGATYTITVTNVGAGATSGTVTVTDTLPAGLTPTAPNGVVNGWTCGIASQTVTCTRSDALAASASYPAITLTVDVALSAAAAVTNTADVAGGSESNTANNSASDPTTIMQLSADLSIAKSHTGNFTQGQTGATYTITVTNVGSGATSGTVTVTDTLPAGLTPIAPNGVVNGWTCGIAGQTVTCTRSDALAASASYPAITLTVDVDTSAGAAVTNTADVSGSGESNTANNSASDPTTIIQLSADLTIAKSHTGNFTQGQTGATYTITVTNVGAGATSGTVTVTDTLPAGLTPTAPNGVVNGWTCGIAGQTVTCTRSDALAASASYPAITLTVDVDTNAGAAVTNTADVSGGGETNTANNTASDSTTIAPSSDVNVSIAKTASDNPVAGRPLTYTITVSNTGSTTAALVVVTDVLPATLTYVSATPSQGSCSGATTVVCTLGALANGANATIALQAIPAAAGPVSNTATLSTAPQFNTGGSGATAAVIVAPASASDIPTVGGWALIFLAISFAFAGAFTLKQ
jgi:uncharacterized repeat protein (TIGR01451 family)